MWIPREKLSSVDRLKKIIDHDDWRTTKSFFEILNNLCGLLTTDKFEDHKNSKTGRFNSKFMFRLLKELTPSIFIGPTK